MKGGALARAVGIVLSVCFLLGLAGWYYVGTRAFMEAAGAAAADKGAELLGCRLDIGSVRVASLRSLEILDIAVYDKEGQPVVKAESALVRFSFFGVLSSSPIEAVSSVALHRPEVWLRERRAGVWNYEDLITDEGEPSPFRGEVTIAAGTLHVAAQQGRLSFTEAAGRIDMADRRSLPLEFTARQGESRLMVSGELGEDGQLYLDGQAVALGDYIPWLPAGTLPEAVQIHGGELEQVAMALSRRHGAYRCAGQARIAGGHVTVMGREVRELQGLVDFSDKGAGLYLGAELEGQRAAVYGQVTLGAAPQIELAVESEGLDPSKLFPESPFQGAVAFRANVSGIPSQLTVEGDFRAASGSFAGQPVAAAAVHAVFGNGRLAVQSLQAEALGGKIEGAGEYDFASQRYDGTVKLTDVQAASWDGWDFPAQGRISADLGFSGEGQDMSKLRLYGTAAAQDAVIQGVAVPELKASLYRQGERLVLDHASLRLEGDGEIGLEGVISAEKGLDLSFSGRHVDMSLVQRFVAAADMSGHADVQGTLVGDMANPHVKVTFAAENGHLFKQPFRTLRGAASGSLDGVGIDSFSMENGNGVNWLVQGTIGFSGERRIQLQIDTMNVRMEDIAALVAPEQPITGEVDNIITITGTLDNPDVVGYIHFIHGSYRGYLLSGMDGDYTLKDGVLTLQDFHIFSPRVDMDLNGTIITASRALDLHVAVYDVDLERVKGDSPYPIQGHGTFDGHIGGTISQPTFDGVLTAPELVVNGALVTKGHGQVTLRGNKLVFAPFQFEQNGGLYTLRATTNIDTLQMEGHAEVKNGDMNGLLAIIDVKNDMVQGRIDGAIDFAGTLEKPTARLALYMPQGEVGGYPVTAVQLDGSLRNRIITLNRFDGRQGEGAFAAAGVIDLDGDIKAQLSARQIQAGMVANAAGMTLPLKGTVDFEAQFGGTAQAPTADASLTLDSGGASEAFDTLVGLFKWRGSVLRVEQLLLQKEKNGHAYRASAYGAVPLKAITSRLGEAVSDFEAIDLQVSLEEADLGLLPFLTPEIDWAMGTTYGSLHIGGTLAAPSCHGALGVKDGALKLRSLALPFTDLQFGLKFEDDTLTITDGSGRMGDGGLRLEGSTRLSGRQPVDYHLAATADRLEIQSDFYRGPFSGTLDLREGFDDDGRRLPKLTARLFIDDALISVPKIPERQGELPELLLDVGLELGRHTHFYSSRLYDMWLEGGVRYGGTTWQPQPSGTIQVRRGTVTYVQTPFRIREGVLSFNQVDSFLPSLAFQADARLNRTRIQLKIRGPFEAMDFQLTSTPAMRQEEILRLLTLRGAYRSGQSLDSTEMTASFLEAGLQMSVLNAFEDTMREFLRLDEFLIVQDLSDLGKEREDRRLLGAYNVQIGKYISDKVLLRYTQGVNHSLSRFSVRYDFNDRFSVVFSHSNDNDTRIGFESRISF